MQEMNLTWMKACHDEIVVGAKVRASTRARVGGGRAGEQVVAVQLWK